MTNANIIFLTHLRKIGDNCKTLRIKKGWSIAQLSIESNITEMTLYNLERGGDNVTMRTMTNVAVALDVEIQSLLG